MAKVLTILGRLLLVAVVFALGVVMHEVGHAAAARALGGKNITISLAPGIQVYPTIEPTEWDRPWFGWAGWRRSLSWGNGQDGLIALAGSATTFHLSVIALAALYALRPRGTLRWVLLAFSLLLFIDLLRYSTISLVGPRAYLHDPVKAPTLTCNGRESYTRESAPGTQVEPVEVHVTGFECSQGHPKVTFELHDVSHVRHVGPVFFQMDTPCGAMWGVAEDGDPGDDQLLFDYRSDCGPGDYVITSAHAVVNGLRGLIVIGETNPEPLVGAILLGIAPGAFLGSVVLASIVHAGLLVNYLRLQKAADAPGDSIE